MCGIVGVIATSGNRVPELVEGLRRLEYRGYDSAGVATITDGTIMRARAEGKIDQLAALLEKSPIEGSVGIGHTRWATHGAPNQKNAHPHATDKVAVVHNGIIENFADLRQTLKEKGYDLESDTDTEVVPFLITDYLNQGFSAKEAVIEAVNALEGAFALGIVFSDESLLVAARKGSPLAVGYADGATYIGSDAIALAPYTPSISYLEEGDIAFITPEATKIVDVNREEAKRDIVQSSALNIAIGKENFRHFMLKEIYEQPSVVSDTLNAYLNPVKSEIHLPNMTLDMSKVNDVYIIACGTSYYAGLVAKYWMEQYAGVTVHIDIASEFRYRPINMAKHSMAICISQSGETADTLASLRYIKENSDAYTIAVVNVMESTMAREADGVLPIYAGPEIGVASTKAFTTQLMTLASLMMALAKERKSISDAEYTQLSQHLVEVPARMAEILNHSDMIEAIAHECAQANHILYIGRGTDYAIAMEGALKLKEISYIHAEATAAGELKHGPIALVDEHVPVVAIAPSNALFDKTASNIQEVAARGGKIILLSDKKGVKTLKDVTYKAINLPECHDFIAPMLYAIPIQLLAYYVANVKGTDIDQPRNLAKSVTVE